jgi:hypothetical protein
VFTGSSVTTLSSILTASSLLLLSLPLLLRRQCDQIYNIRLREILLSVKKKGGRTDCPAMSQINFIRNPDSKHNPFVYF